MVIVNVHVFDFLIHLSKFAFCDISFKYPLEFKKKKHKTRAFLKNPWVFPKKPGGLGFL